MSNTALEKQIPSRSATFAAGNSQPILYASALWHVILAVAFAVLAWRIFSAENFSILGKAADLGTPVQYFAALLILSISLVSVTAAFQMLTGKIQGRYFSLGLNFTGLILTFFGLMGVWGVYDSFELLVDGIMANAYLTLGFALTYAIFWIANRFDEDSTIRAGLEKVAFGLAMLTLIAILLASNILGGFSHILSTYGNGQTWLMTGAFFIFAVLFWLVLHLGEYFNETPDQRTAWQGWLMLSPNILGFIFFFAGPLLLSLYLSFTDSTVGRIPNFNAGQNYIDILSFQVKTAADDSILAQNTLDRGYTVLNEFHWSGTRYIIGAKDRLFWISLRNTVVFCIMLLPLAIIPALGMSLILNSKLPGVKFFRAVYFLPSVAAVVGTAIIWRWLYQPTEGFINYSIRSIAAFLGTTDPNIQWLTEPTIVLLSVVILSAWQVVGYNTVLFLAGLQGIPDTLYEAAQIDGANKWQQFQNVTLPMLAPTTFFVIITTMVTGLQVFNEPYALFPARPIPENATTSVYYLYTQGFNQFQFGYASSVAWVLFALIFLLTLLQFRMNRNQAYS